MTKKLEITKNSKLTKKTSKLDSKFSRFFLNFEFMFEIFVNFEFYFEFCVNIECRNVVSMKNVDEVNIRFTL